MTELPAEVFARRLAEAFNRESGVRERFREFFTDEPEIIPFRGLIEGTVYRGPSAVDDFWREVDETWSEIQVEVEGARYEAGWLVSVGRLSGRGKASGIPVSAKLAWLADLRQGKIARFRTYGGEAQALDALRGLVEPD